MAFLLTACASRGENLKAEFSISPEEILLNVPFIAQTDYHCGSASLAMVVNNLGNKITSDELSQMVYTPGSSGTFQNDLISATRRLGLIAIPINNIRQIFNEINNKNPILVFQNLGLSWMPRWHYAVVVGYDLRRNEIVLHSGNSKNFRLNIRTFEKTWNRVQNWGLLIVKAGSIPQSASEIDMVKSTAGLEIVHHFDQALVSYKEILKKWPESLGALVGIANISFLQNNLTEAKNDLEMAIKFHPQAAGVWHNYAQILKNLKLIKEARFAAKKAIEFSDPASTKIYAQNLKSLLDAN